MRKAVQFPPRSTSPEEALMDPKATSQTDVRDEREWDLADEELDGALAVDAARACPRPVVCYLAP
jgi:hypothetical protein